MTDVRLGTLSYMTEIVVKFQGAVNEQHALLPVVNLPIQYFMAVCDELILESIVSPCWGNK